MSETRTSDRNVDRAIRSWLREDRYEDVSRVAGAVLDLLDTTPQRRSPWWPARRILFMNKFGSHGLGAAAAVVALVIGTQVLGPSAPGGVGGAPSASPSPTPAPTATTEPSPSPIAAPPLTQTFTSQMHGISVSYPEGWIARAATEPLTDRPGVPQFVDPGFDVLQDPVLADHLFLYIASQPIGDSTPEDWVAALVASEGCTTTEPIAVDGATGLIGADCRFAFVTTGGRGYEIGLYASGDDFSQDPSAPYDRAWFEEVLATVQLRPEDAVVAPSASP
ncbi:MAG TPA: hypothetical protein VK867_00335 [Candidatus Limnocylindrales bacterium]|nr:hypothetical protein [Candidatus Limnocylindrales bacterium]